MLWIAFVAVVVLLLAWFVISENECDRLLRSVPGPRRLPISGNILEYLGLNQADIFVKTRGFAERYGGRYMLKVFNRRILNILNPDDAEVVSLPKIWLKVAMAGPGVMLVNGCCLRRLACSNWQHDKAHYDSLSSNQRPAFKTALKILLICVRLQPSTYLQVLLSSSKNIKKSFVYSFLSSWLHDGLLLSDGAKWHDRRKILTPAFHFNILKEFSGVIEENSWRLVRELQDECCRETTDVTPLVSQFALHSICETAMGTQLDGDKSKTALEYKSAIAKVGHMFFERLTRFWQHSDFIYSHTSDGRKYQKHVKIIHSFPEKVIKDRRDSRLQEKETKTPDEDLQDDDVYMKKKKRMAMLDLLLDAESRHEIDEKGIEEEVHTFMFEGHDTTAMAITHALMLLANHQHVQEAVYEECAKIFSGSSRAATMAELSELRYLEACIKETLRLYPSVPFISRTLSEDMQLSDIVVKAGTTCHIHIYDIQRRADIFQDPAMFKPERFLAENMDVNRHPFGYVPFSAGPRNCIGQRFAMLEMKSVVSAIVRSYRLCPVTQPQDMVFLADLVLRPRGPVYVKFVKR